MTESDFRPHPRGSWETQCGICGLACCVSGDVWRNVPGIDRLEGDDDATMAMKVATMFCPCRDRRPDA